MSTLLVSQTSRIYIRSGNRLVMPDAGSAAWFGVLYEFCRVERHDRIMLSQPTAPLIEVVA